MIQSRVLVSRSIGKVQKSTVTSVFINNTGAFSVPAAAAAAASNGGVQFQQQRNLAVNPNDILKRIVSTKSIRKITKSMKMVSAAKLKQDEKRLNDGKHFGKSFDGIFGNVTTTLEELTTGQSKLSKDEKAMVAVISSDRGLCGGINSFVAKAARNRIDQLVAAGKDASLFVMGGKGEGALRRTHGKKIVGSVDETWKTPMNFAKASVVASKILAAASDLKEIDIVFNRFKSIIVYTTTVRAIPNFPAIYKAAGDEAGLPAPLDQYELEPELAAEALQNMMEYGLAVVYYGSSIDNATSEQSARMTAMDNASKNAGEMINKLTVQFNRARQSKITTELIEIISGAESLKSSQ